MRKNGEPHRHEPEAELAFIDDIEVSLSDDKSRKESPEDGERLL